MDSPEPRSGVTGSCFSTLRALGEHPQYPLEVFPPMQRRKRGLDGNRPRREPWRRAFEKRREPPACVVSQPVQHVAHRGRDDGFGGAAGPFQRVGRRPPRGELRRGGILLAHQRQRRGEAEMRSRVTVVACERLSKPVRGVDGITLLQRDQPEAVVRRDRKFPRVQPSAGRCQLALELTRRLRIVFSREQDEAEQPVQPARGKTLAALLMPFANDDALTQRLFRERKFVARDVDHRDLEVREREVGIERQRLGMRPQPLVAPRRVSQPEVMRPVRRIERHRAPARRARFLDAVRAHQNERECRVRVGQLGIERHRLTRRVHRAPQQRRVRRVQIARRFVGPEQRVGEADVGRRERRIVFDRCLEVRDRVRHEIGVERFEPPASFEERARRFQTRTLTRPASGAQRKRRRPDHALGAARPRSRRAPCASGAPGATDASGVTAAMNRYPRRATVCT